MICIKHNANGCRCKTTSTPTAPQNAFTKRSRTRFKNFKANPKNKWLPFAMWPGLFKRMLNKLSN